MFFLAFYIALKKSGVVLVLGCLCESHLSLTRCAMPFLCPHLSGPYDTLSSCKSVFISSVRHSGDPFTPETLVSGPNACF